MFALARQRWRSKTMHFKRVYKSFDYVLLLLVIGLCALGIVMLASVAANPLNPEKVAVIASGVYKSQYMWVITGIFVLLAAAFVDFEVIGRFYIIIYGVNILLLALVLFFGKSDTDAARWLMLKDFGIPLEFGIQPSEFTKIFMIIYLAKFIDKYKDRINNVGILLITVAVAMVPIFLIAVQPSLSASIVPLVILATMLYTAKINYRYIVIVLAILIPLAAFLYYDLNSENHIIIDKIAGYQIKRIEAIRNPEANPVIYDQAQRSMTAISSGQLMGKGLFKNTVYVPYAYNDFIFSAIGAELGFVGCVGVLGVMFIIVGKCLWIAHKSEVFFGKLMASGVAAMFAFQAFVNVSVAIGILPTTGIVFPFISSGGSSMWINMGCVGLVINVGMTKTKLMFED